MMRARTYGLWAMSLGAILSLTACQQPDRLTFDNFQQVHKSVSTKTDVTAVLGSPDSDMGGLWMYTRPDKHLVVMIDFDAAGRVTRSQWIDAMAEQWQDTDDKPAPAKP